MDPLSAAGGLRVTTAGEDTAGCHSERSEEPVDRLRALLKRLPATMSCCNCQGKVSWWPRPCP